MSSDNYEEKYTKPALRRKIKAEIKQSDKGGDPGQWSARKSQMLVQEYEKQGGGYKKDEKDEAAKSLEEWTEQNWQTAGGKGDARQGDITKRYLPEAVWNRLSEAEQREAECTKEKGSKSGDQYVGWTPAIQRAMAAEGYVPGSSSEPTKEALYQQAQDLDIEGRSQMDKNELQQAVKTAQADQLQQQTRDQLYEQAQSLDIEGRSQMNKDALVEAIQAQSDPQG
ncbi:Rho termination factor N-terminal domain-containing protein [Vasconcelosia minhoensis]|nr:Rho termination factor N-terminal domain-containing protein [Romeria gracilis]